MGRMAAGIIFTGKYTMKPGLIFCIRSVFYLCVMLMALTGMGGVILTLFLSKDLPKLPNDLNRMTRTAPTIIYSSTGSVVRQFGDQSFVPLSLVSRDFINAIVATEDHEFFSHNGINPLRILKALYLNLTDTGKMQGASTITQQLAKNLFFSFGHSYKRKFLEMLISFQMEYSHSKEQILEAYINQIHFAPNAKGVEKAANLFFSRPASELTLDQAALLAGLTKSPTVYNPFRHPEKALARRKIVLARMVAAGYITQDQASTAQETPLNLKRQKTDARGGSYFIDTLVKELIERFDETVVFNGGLQVFSTLDPRLDDLARQTLQRGMEDLDHLMGIDPKNPVKPQGALVAMDTQTGAIRVMLGGRNYLSSEFNRAKDSLRQPGSAFKPFVYYTAFQRLGLHPGSVLTDKKVSIPVTGSPVWEPKNFTKRHRGPMILKKALTLSVNTIAAQLVQRTGPQAVMDTARACGIKSPLKPVYSIALGSSAITPLEMTAAYGVLANMGIYREPFMIRRVEDSFGRVLFQHVQKQKQTLNPAISYQIVDMMKSVLDQGTGRSIRKRGFTRIAAGKTGTTNDFVDSWFAGFTPGLCASVWVGFDNPSSLRDSKKKGITGARGAAPIWADFMNLALEQTPERDFPRPSHVRFARVHPVTGCTVPANTKTKETPMTIVLRTGQKVCHTP